MADENIIKGIPSDQPDRLEDRVAEIELRQMEMYCRGLATEWALLEISQLVGARADQLKTEIDRKAEEKFQEWLSTMSDLDPRGAAGIVQLRERIVRARGEIS